MQVGDRVVVNGDNARGRADVSGTVIDISPTWGVCVEFDHGGGAWFTVPELWNAKNIEALWNRLVNRAQQAVA